MLCSNRRLSVCERDYVLVHAFYALFLDHSDISVPIRLCGLSVLLIFPSFLLKMWGKGEVIGCLFIIPGDMIVRSKVIKSRHPSTPLPLTPCQQTRQYLCLKVCWCFLGRGVTNPLVSVYVRERMKEKERSENSIDATMLVVITPRYRLFVPFSAMIFTLKLTISSSPTPTSPADLSSHLPNGVTDILCQSQRVSDICSVCSFSLLDCAAQSRLKLLLLSFWGYRGWSYRGCAKGGY